ncbi:glucose-6-phosphate dehydrogenase [Siminovitchia acidinfaciens]|uniref:Glucose-6-phosphate 1-dehydrogenase n=1 Tax=Siminovitchia acidinfaciens TaxID=2321395 RepID=A0A429Y0B3_9BACI|nr:glucose-6-phosphate dehydrogenase [Siminovitchia acidinfaciens]RST74409.1 glucose-6-phosphate dehydrogenase [Siminovitchia acidinfaciens]
MDPLTFVLFGATGDLAKRKIFPTLYHLFLDGKLPASFSVIGLGRREWTDNVLRTHIKESLNHFSKRFSEECSRMDTFLDAIHYVPLDVTDQESYNHLLKQIQKREAEHSIPENRLFYLSVAPDLIDTITTNIQKSGLGDGKGWKRLIIEKPFGSDLTSAQLLNKKLTSAFEESEIYRIDHYLGKSMVQNLEVLKFANPIFQSSWNPENISNVQITASETVGVEDRASYYDRAGAIRDMFQNHMLQMLMMTAMQVPEQLNASSIRQEKRKIMEFLQPLKKEDFNEHIVRGQYGPGKINGTPVVGYREEPGIEAVSQNDTFIAARLFVHYPDSGPVPFYIRTGKRMKEKSTRIVIEFKNRNKDLYKGKIDQAEPNLLDIEINKEGMSLQLNLKNPATKQIEPISFSFAANAKETPGEYELLLYDALRGDSTFFAHWEEVELSWQWVQPILEAFDEDLLPLHFYPSGSMGPEAADRLLEKDGFTWW